MRRALIGVTLLAVATLTHALVSATKRRARDLAILKVLGFRRGQLRAVVAWQATGLALTASLVGLQLGIAVGRATWVVFAGHLGVVADPVTPIAMIALLPVAILIANLAAAIPGRFAAATRPALTLRPQ